jgi:hypothetical protein
MMRYALLGIRIVCVMTDVFRLQYFSGYSISARMFPIGKTNCVLLSSNCGTHHTVHIRQAYRNIFLTLNIVLTYSLCSILKNTDQMHCELLCNQLYRSPEILK